MKIYWEGIADNLSKAGWSWGCVSALDSERRTICIGDAHRSDGKRFVVRADEKLTAFFTRARTRGNLLFHGSFLTAKRGLRQAEGREAQPTPDRTLKLSNLSPRGPTNLKATLAHASRVPTPGNLTLTNPAQPKGRPEHIIARKQANAKPVVRPSDLKDNNES